MIKRKITFGSQTKEYFLVKKKRKTMKLTVKPDMKIILHCPEEVTEEKITEFLYKKWLWIEKQLSFFKKYQKKIYKKEYVSGESFYYLGRQYQLIVKKSDKDRVTLSQGKLIVEISQDKKQKNHIKLLIDIWYKDKANLIFKERFNILFDKFNYDKKILFKISKMKRKWGSFKKETIVLNPLLIQASKDSIDYVITHELCHVRYKNHNKDFWKFMDEMYPGWEKVKEKLEIKFG